LENNNIEFFQHWFEKVPYLKAHPEYHGFHKIAGDHLGRSVPWALLKGEGADTVVLIHHTDTVNVDDYGSYKKYAYSPIEITEKYRQDDVEMDDHSKKDLQSGEWLFGRGAADMKGGAAIHLALFEQYSASPQFKGNILLMGLPDEENLSAEMRGAVPLIKELKNKYQLNYKLMLNVEPHERNDNQTATIYDGSVGKIMPIFYVRGKLAHVGQIFQGLNPINLLSEIVRRTELNPEYIEKAGNTTTPPPAWLYMKDRKDFYDVSLPIAAAGYMNVLTLDKGPAEIFTKLEQVCEGAFNAVIDDMNRSYKVYLESVGEEYKKLEWKPKVKKYGELYQDALANAGSRFTDAISDLMKIIKVDVIENKVSMAECAFRIIEKTLEYVNDTGPMVIIALAPPYYPNVHNSMIPEHYGKMQDLTRMIIEYARNHWNQEYEVQSYYTGICDLSYGMFKANNEDINYIEENMLMWNDIYYIPLDAIKEISMPVLNLGPWGKDFHKYTERVYMEDLYERTPTLVNEVIQTVLK
jgi:arginine utilization protein RocB